MNRPKILIVDDEAPARQRLATLLSDIQQECPCDLVGEASDGQTALDQIALTKPDIVLLDVQMPGMTGLELAQHLSSDKDLQMPAIIFVTAYDEYALKAFEVHAMDYLLKPVRASRLAGAIMRISHLKSGAQKSAITASVRDLPAARQCFSVVERNRVLLIPVVEVLFLKAEQKYVTLHTKLRSYLLEESLTSIEDEMVKMLVRVHRNALVARSAIIGVERATHIIDAENENEKATESWQVILRDTQERLPISRRQWPVIKGLVR
jgi:two-component system response regulator AlgR